MKRSFHSFFALLAFLPAALSAHHETEDQATARNCGCACCTDKGACCGHEEKSADGAKSAHAKRHPLKGVIVDIPADRSSLLVKHEKIPGYMRAMTMLLKVDAVTQKAVTEGQAVTGTLVERDGGFWLEDVKPAR